MFCGQCSKENPDDSKFCAGCGSPVNDTSNENTSPPPNHNPNQRPAQWKSEGTTLILTIILGIFGFGGIGHIYLGNITRGIVILIVGIVLLVIAVFSMGIGLIILIPFAIWVVYDARKQCRYYNNYLEQNQRPPW
jgi:TM2 domain-containing membrane protein YozV